MSQPTTDNYVLFIHVSEAKAAIVLLCFPLLCFVPIVSSLLFANTYTLVLGVVAWIGVLRLVAGGPKVNCVADLRGKFAIVTGSNTGIGKEASLELARMGCDVIIACRDVKKGEAAIKYIRQQLSKPSSKTNGTPNLECMSLDLQDFDSIRTFVKQIEQKNRKVNILLNNAGALMTQYGLTKHGIESTIATNHVGNFLLTNLLLPHIPNGSRIVNVSSLGHSLAPKGIEVDDILHPDPKKFNKFRIYGASKLANIWFTNHLQKKLEGTGTIACSVHPGAVRTELNRHQSLPERLAISALSLIMKLPEQGAVPLVYCCVHPAVIGARYYSDCAIYPTTTMAQDEKRASELWEKTSKLVGPPYF